MHDTEDTLSKCGLRLAMSDALHNARITKMGVLKRFHLLLLLQGSDFRLPVFSGREVASLQLSEVDCDRLQDPPGRGPRLEGHSSVFPFPKRTSHTCKLSVSCDCAFMELGSTSQSCCLMVDLLLYKSFQRVFLLGVTILAWLSLILTYRQQQNVLILDLSSYGTSGEFMHLHNN